MTSPPLRALADDKTLGARVADCGCCYVVDLVALDELRAALAQVEAGMSSEVEWGNKHDSGRRSTYEHQADEKVARWQADACHRCTLVSRTVSRTEWTEVSDV